MNRITNSDRTSKPFGTLGRVSKNLLTLAAATIFALYLMVVPPTVTAQNQPLIGITR
jgi:hypothetical protein